MCDSKRIDRSGIEIGVYGRAANGERARFIEVNRATAERPLESGVIDVVAEDCVGGTETGAIHCAASGDAEFAKLSASEILNCEIRRRARDRYAHCARSNCTVSPGQK